MLEKYKRKQLLKFYDANADELESAWEEHVEENHWGSGADKITITTDMFWEFVEDRYEEHKEQQKRNFVAKYHSWYKTTGWKIDLLVVAALVVYILRVKNLF